MNDNEKKLYEEYGRLQNEHKIALGNYKNCHKHRNLSQAKRYLNEAFRLKQEIMIIQEKISHISSGKDDQGNSKSR